jgi:uncharacterized protein (TIGR02391 family)
MGDERPWFQLAPDEILALPVDQLGLRILVEVGSGSDVRWNAVGRIETDEGASREAKQAMREAKQAISEAWWWLIRKGLIAPDAQNADDRWWLRTRLGHEVAERPEGLARLRAGERVDVELHPRIAEDVRAEFLQGKFETAVFTAMREVEIVLREKTSAPPPKDYGQDLVNYAFGSRGKLVDAFDASAEEQAIGHLFRGAIGAFKNPPSHRRVDFDDPTEAAEIVLFASLLLRILDRLGEA